MRGISLKISKNFSEKSFGTQRNSYIGVTLVPKNKVDLSVGVIFTNIRKITVVSVVILRFPILLSKIQVYGIVDVNRLVAADESCVVSLTF